MSVNYLIEINGLDVWELTHPLPATAYKLMRKLQYLANTERFPERMTVSNGLLMSMVQCSEDSLIKARNQLIQAGLISYKGQKKLTPLYMIHYFSNNPVYNSKIASYEQGIKQGYEQGLQPGFAQGMKQGTYINKSNPGETDQTSFGSDEEHTATEHSKGARVLVAGKGEFDRAFPIRIRELDGPEQRNISALKFFFAARPDAAKLFEPGRYVLDRLLASDRFPLELVEEAVYMTERRNSRFALDNPTAYMLTLLFDWEDRGIKTVEALQESKDDWWGNGAHEA